MVGFYFRTAVFNIPHLIKNKYEIMLFSIIDLEIVGQKEKKYDYKFTYV